MKEDYKIELEIFEGPLDLLLYLIRREELNIYDIPINRITEQYLAYLELMQMLDLNIAGEFVKMAATLMYIKSYTMSSRMNKKLSKSSVLYYFSTFKINVREIVCRFNALNCAFLCMFHYVIDIMHFFLYFPYSKSSSCI